VGCTPLKMRSGCQLENISLVAARAQSETEMAYLRANADESVAHRVMAVQSAHAERP